MGFTSETFLFVFLPIAVIVQLIAGYKLNKPKLSNLLLIGMSIVFYAWAGISALLFFIVYSMFVYVMGRAVSGREKNGKTKLVLSVGFLIAVLAYCKYMSFALSQLGSLLSKEITARSIIAPAGISFIVFESVSYVVDIYRGDAEAGTFLDELLFLSLFPKILSGPIVLWRDFKPQIENRSVSGDDISSGIDRIIIGFAKKAIIADSLGYQKMLIDGAAGGIDCPTAWLCALLYFFQIYYDFSGYSDIAIGLCRIFGFDIKENFNFPYISKSVSEFWRRWHISLGSWFREYVYIPMGGNRKGNVYLNLFVVFLLTGIWHGANWTFGVWGIINGLFVVLERYLRDKKWYAKIPDIVKWLFTTAVIFFSWIMFMSPDIGSAMGFYKTMFSATALTPNFTWKYYLTAKTLILLIIAAVGSVMGAFEFSEKAKSFVNGNETATAVKRVLYLVLFVISILFVVNSTYSPFLYFQF